MSAQAPIATRGAAVAIVDDDASVRVSLRRLCEAFGLSATVAHPRGRITGSRAGVHADWRAVFAAAAEANVAVEIDGDPSRQDLDYSLASLARDAGCLFALDSDAHSTSQLHFRDVALAHARLARIPPARIVNCWDFERLDAWLREGAT